MDFPTNVSKSDAEQLSSNDSDQADDERILSMSESERANQNIDISVSSVTVYERSNAFSEESNEYNQPLWIDLLTTSSPPHRSTLADHPVMDPMSIICISPY